MGELVPFKRPKPSEKHQGKTLCQHGFHKWQVVTDQHFDVKQGKLVTLFKCARCSASKTEAR